MRRFMQSSALWLVIAGLVTASPGPAQTAGGKHGGAVATRTVEVAAARDNTLIESAEGDLSNGKGPLFIGRTRQIDGFSLRRGLVAFDVAAVVPAGATVTSATLTLTSVQAPPEVVTLTLHQVAVDWGEGDSRFDGGRGAPAAPGDATWTYASYDTRRWNRPGGDFVEKVSATSTVNGASAVVFGPTSEMRADVQAGLDHPQSNFGWVLVGEEGEPGSARRFASREADDAAARPRLTVTYQPRR
jgi:hypothetical protein